jgi:general secretion pathway protein C
MASDPGDAENTMNRTWILVANGALLVLCCFLAARILASVAGEVLAPEAGAVAAPPPSGRTVASTWQDRQVILDRNLFNVSTLAPRAAEAPEDEHYEQTQLPLELLGTVAAADQAMAWAAVLDRETRQHLVVRVGDRLKDRAEVVRIDRRRLVLDNAGSREELAIAEGDETRTARAPSRPAPRRRVADRSRGPSVDVERLARNRFAVPRDDVESLAANPAALFSQARILPKYQDGQMVGVQLNAIKEGSLFSEIGIQDGDVINEINGIEVTGQQESAQVLRELTEATEFNVTVTGSDGQRRVYQYEVQ